MVESDAASNDKAGKLSRVSVGSRGIESNVGCCTTKTPRQEAEQPALGYYALQQMLKVDQ